MFCLFRREFLRVFGEPASSLRGKHWGIGRSSTWQGSLLRSSSKLRCRIPRLRQIDKLSNFEPVYLLIDLTFRLSTFIVNGGLPLMVLELTGVKLGHEKSVNSGVMSRVSVVCLCLLGSRWPLDPRNVRTRGCSGQLRNIWRLGKPLPPFFFLFFTPNSKVFF